MPIIQSPPHRSSRPKPALIRTIPEEAPWVLLSKAADDSGLTELLIRKANLQIRKFGNAFYVAPAALNAWILKGSHPQP